MMTNPILARRRKAPRRRGVSLMEVLISTFVLSIGLLGIASLIPVGQLSVFEANKLDRAGHVGRWGLHNVKVWRMIDFNTWATQPSGTDSMGRVIDPLGLTKGMPATLGGLPRIGLNAVPESAFWSSDDLAFEMPKDRNIRPTCSAPGASTGDYSWLCTVMPSAGEAAAPWIQKTQFEVSVAVAYKRGFTGNDSNGIPFEQTAQGTFLVDGATAATMPVSCGGGTFQPSAGVVVKENTWVLAVGTNQARWYRVIAAGDTPTDRITLAGPDWNNATSSNVTLVVIKGIIGVYSQTMEVDRDPFWTPQW